LADGYRGETSKILYAEPIPSQKFISDIEHFTHHKSFQYAPEEHHSWKPVGRVVFNNMMARNFNSALVPTIDFNFDDKKRTAGS